MKKIVVIVFIPMIFIFMMLSSMMSMQSSSDKKSTNSSVKNVCSYDVKAKFDDEEIEKQKEQVSKYVVNDDYQNVVLAIYSMDKKQDVKDISLVVNKMIEYNALNNIKKNYESYVQAYVFGNEYFSYLNERNVDTNVDVAKAYQKEHGLDSSTYRYATKALSNLKTDCSFNDSGMPIKKPYQISGWYPTYDKSGRGYRHVGIDFAVPLNTPMYAIKDSEVVAIGTSCQVGFMGSDCGDNGVTGAGNYVMLKFSDKKEIYYVSYMHLTKPNVSTGDKILKGQLVGYSGNTGNSSGPHCHFEVHKNPISITDIGVGSKTHINPCEYIKGLCD